MRAWLLLMLVFSAPAHGQAFLSGPLNTERYPTPTNAPCRFTTAATASFHKPGMYPETNYIWVLTFYCTDGRIIQWPYQNMPNITLLQEQAVRNQQVSKPTKVQFPASSPQGTDPIPLLLMLLTAALGAGFAVYTYYQRQPIRERQEQIAKLKREIAEARAR